MDTGFSLLYVTAPSRDVAMTLAHALVGERLAACANLLGPIQSVYWWDGKVNDEPEVALILKTRTELVPEATERLRALHPYSCPCVVAIAIDGGNPAFLGWLAAETARI
ncbi:divalent-cation tolerance protein CutA [Magnetospirillum moscoviense]|uniref:Dihydroorotate dehydrogenase n=1 Tax=Magnetospirillum moscoviense TaxID=1437059 RepID=A0A178MPZ5_9PROT|nr:divalent-cation tolerance protein CutA [Magnetospirillum moscoviense]MBF0323766.1 divalent-cation tolerance protein CutA [Alphaproteobacteria bacterium]OAN50633.1 dihydroorotate dehydrogenase [Magnetospirillum moscoviense]